MAIIHVETGVKIIFLVVHLRRKIITPQEINGNKTPKSNVSKFITN